MKSKTYYRDCKCEFCNKEFKTINGMNGHKVHCKLNPSKITIWNKGLTKETNELVSQYTKSMTETKNTTEWKDSHDAWNKGLTKETSDSVLKYTTSMNLTKSTLEWKEELKTLIYAKYDGKHYTQTSEYKEKCRTLCFIRYGVYHPMHVQQIFDKTLNATYRRKEYELPDGKIIKVQGYENYAFDYIFAHNYSIADIEFKLPELFYTFNDKKCRYYPDIFLKSENLLIEVKSTYTMECDKDKNILKQKATTDQGFNHEFWIIIPNKEIYKVRNVDEYYSRIPMGRNNIRRV